MSTTERPDRQADECPECDGDGLDLIETDDGYDRGGVCVCCDGTGHIKS